MLEDDGLCCSMRNNVSTTRVAAFEREGRSAVCGNAHRENDAEGATLDYEVLEEGQKIGSHLSDALVDEEGQCPLAGVFIAGTAARELFK